MRTFEHTLSVALFSFGIGLNAAYALDGTRSPANVAPPMGLGSAPEAGLGLGVGAERVKGFGAFKQGSQAIDAGDTKAGLEMLNDAARSGNVLAAWKLGHMFAEGVDGVKRDDRRAFEYFRALADSHADETTGTAEARFVANAFVVLGGYYLTGIPNSDIKPDVVRAREMFSYAATYFGDSDAQYHLGRMYLDGQGTAKDTKQALRWLFAAASKGQYEAQAVFGALLFRGQSVPRDGARGLMWLMLARDSATPKETWIADQYAAAWKQATQEEQAAALARVEQWVKNRRD